MLPSRVDVVIIIIILSYHMFCYGICMIIVYRTALIFRIKIFKHNIANYIRIFEIYFCSQHDVFQIIHKELFPFPFSVFITIAIAIIIKQKHSRVILKKLICIDAYLKQGCIVIQTKQPTAQVISFHVGIYVTIRYVLTTWNKGIPIAAEARPAMSYHGSIVFHIIRRATEETGHFQPHLQRYGEETVFIAYFKISCFGMV